MNAILGYGLGRIVLAICREMPFTNNEIRKEEVLVRLVCHCLGI